MQILVSFYSFLIVFLRFNFKGIKMNKILFLLLSCIIAHGSINAMGIDNLLMAAEAGDIMSVEVFLFRRFEINARNGLGNTPLIEAAQGGHLEVVRKLLSVPGVDVNARNKDNETALMWAAAKGYQDVVRELLQIPGIDVSIRDTQYKRNALDWAQQNGHSVVVNMIKEH